MPGPFSPAFFDQGALMPLELSLFCDESGSDALDGNYYLLALVIHDQSDSITESIARYERSLVNKGLPDLAFHASPLLNAKDEYKSLPPETRKKLLSSFRVFFRHLPIRYWAFSLRTKEHSSTEDVGKAAADFVCTMEFTALKYLSHTTTATDEKFFGSWSMFKKGILKEVRAKRL